MQSYSFGHWYASFHHDLRFRTDPTSQELATISTFLRTISPSSSLLQGALLIQTAPRPSHATRRSDSTFTGHRARLITSLLAIPPLLTAGRVDTAMCEILSIMVTETAGKIADDRSDCSTDFLTRLSGGWVSNSSKDTTPLGTMATRASALLSDSH